jgi:hypothetical protein
MTEESEDARMRALFGEMQRPPMGDEDFVRSVMGRVQEVRVSSRVRRNAMAIGGVALLGAVLWPFKGAIGAAITLSAARYAVDLPMLSSGGAALLIAAAASLAALAYAERG